MDKSKWGVHEGHCCVIHGCKYGDKDCPVVSKETKQKYTCEDCEYDGIEKLEHIEQFLYYQEKVKKVKLINCDEIMVNVNFLERLMNR